MRHNAILRVAMLGLLLGSLDCAAAVWYVDKDNTGSEDGTSWATAFKTIQPAVDAAFADGGGEIWVAEGVYGETRSSIVHLAPSDVDTGSIVLRTGVNLFGGFIGNDTGGNEDTRNKRDWKAHVTTLDGSTSRGGQKAYHVVVGAVNTTLDGFAITAGYANGGAGVDNPLNCGGGMYNDNSMSPLVENCTFTNNMAFAKGGAVFNKSISVVFKSCIVRDNVQVDPVYGGGMYSDTSLLTVQDCTFQGNKCDTYGDTAALYSTNSSVLVQRSRFTANSAYYAVALRSLGSFLNVDLCDFIGNVGGMGQSITCISVMGATAHISRCNFYGNYGGATINVRSVDALIDNCVIRNNSGGDGAVSCVYGESTILANCIIVANANGGVYIHDADVRLTVAHCVLVDNYGAYAINNYGGSPLIKIANSVLWSNQPYEIDMVAVLPSVMYSDIKGGLAGTGNINADPLFRDAARGDYRLQLGSPCIDSGMNASTAEYGNVTTDINGNLRGVDGDGLGAGTIGDGSDYDMGAYEASVPTQPEISVDPLEPVTMDPLVCRITKASEARPGLAVSYEYVWTCGAVRVTHGPKADLTDSLAAYQTKKHETWTCTVRAYDSMLYSAPVSASVSVLNTPPAPLTVSIPLLQADNSNLRCSLNKGSDPDGDVLYAVEWFVRHSGDTGYSVYTGPVLVLDTFTQIDRLDTQPGDRWYCAVTYTDGDVPESTVISDTCTIVLGGITPSFISLAAPPFPVTLGQTVIVSGQIFPTPTGSGTVAFESVSPSGTVSNTFPEGTVFSAGSYTRQFYPNAASEGRTPWNVTATWPGDDTYQSATSVSVPFTVLKSQPSLSLTLSASSVPLSYSALTADATLSADLPPTLAPLLSGRAVRLWIKKPDAGSLGPVNGTTDASGAAHFATSAFTSAGVTLDQAGTWQFTAEFVGDANFKPAVSAPFDQPSSVRLTVKDRAGYAVIVVGKLDATGEGLASHAKTGDLAYRTLRDRGFAHEDIYYLREGPAQPSPDIFVDDTAPSKAGVQYALTTWAQGMMNAVPAPLYVVFVDHGAVDGFFVYLNAGGTAREITPSDLDGWLNVLEGSLSPQALAQDRVFTYGGCHAGSFIDQVSSPGRVLIASCRTDEVSHRGVVDPQDGVREGEAFLTEFFRDLRGGKTLRLAFEEASEKIEEYTATRSNGAEAESLQHPVLDDNGDGLGTSGVLSVTPGEDGAVAHQLVLGYGVNADASVGWLGATQTLYLGPGDPVGVLMARPTRSPDARDRAWLEVKSPSYGGSTVVDLTNPDSQEAVNLVQHDHTHTDAGWYAWDTAAFANVFTNPGTYKVFYYVQDGTLAERPVSTHLVTTIYRGAVSNQPPPAVSLVYPDDGAQVSSAGFFAWTSVTDPDTDPVTYQLEIAEASGFDVLVVDKALLTGTVTQLTALDGLLDGHTYHWRVVPVDQYGASPTVNGERAFTVDNNNPDLPGAISGTVRDAATHNPIAGATVSVSPGGRTALSVSDGSFFVSNLSAGTYALDVGAAGHTAQRRTGVVVVSQGLAEAVIDLASSSSTYAWGDVSGDGKGGTVDASLIKQWKVGLIESFPVLPGVLSPGFPFCADVSRDGVCGTLDASLILQKRVRLITCYPADTNCDGNGPEAKVLDVPRSMEKAAQRAASIPALTEGQPGAEVVIPVSLDDASGVLGYYLRLGYDAAKLEYLGLDNGALTQTWQAPTINAQTGSLRVTNLDAVALGGSGVLLVLHFRIAASALPGDTMQLQFVEFELNDTLIPVTASGGVVAVPGLDEPPTAGFTADRVSGAAPLTVAFTDQSVPGGKEIKAWQWSFGDTATSDQASPSHVYATPGSYDVSLTVTTDAGTDTETKPGYILVTAPLEGEPVVEGEGEGEVASEGEGEVSIEGEGEINHEGEGEVGNSPFNCNCSPSGKSGPSWRDYFGDLMLLGLSMTILLQWNRGK